MKVKFIEEMQQSTSIIPVPDLKHLQSRLPENRQEVNRREMDGNYGPKVSHHPWSGRLSWLADVPAPVAAGPPGRRGGQPGTAAVGRRGRVLQPRAHRLHGAAGCPLAG